MKKFLKLNIYTLRSINKVLRRTIFAHCNHININRGKIAFGKNVFIDNFVRVIFSKWDINENRKIVIGDDSKIHYDSKIIIVKGKLIIGKRVTLGKKTVINVFDDVVIENDVMTADKVNFITNEHNYDLIDKPIYTQGCNAKPIYIGEGSWIGINVTILAGTIIGKNCVVGANSLVKGVFPDYCVIAGSPAHIIKKYDKYDEEWKSIDKI